MGTRLSETARSIIAMLHGNAPDDLETVPDTGGVGRGLLKHSASELSHLHTREHNHIGLCNRKTLNRDDATQPSQSLTPRPHIHENYSNQLIICLNDERLRKKLSKHIRGQGREADPHYLAKKKAYARTHNFNNIGSPPS